MKLFEKLKLKRISELETVEEKSFWMVAIVIVVLGLVSLVTAGSYENMTPTLIAVFLCLFIPAVLIIIVVKTKKYHAAYPMLCIAIGGFSIPFMFIVGGGFFSGMPFFCIILTGITALCYSRKWRVISFVLCLIGNTLAFLAVYLAGDKYIMQELPILGSVTFPLSGTNSLYADMNAVYTVYKDMFFSYYCTSAGLYSVISFTTNDIRRYKLNQDALQQFFDKEKRKEILSKALDTDLSKQSNHKKAAILFADISNFTPITEKMPSDLITKFLNEFFSIIGKYIHGANGIIDKFIGDCVMAYWVDTEDENCVLKAIQSMLDAKKEIINRSEDIYAKYGTELNFSVGLAYGDVIFGDIGSDSMHDYTILGDAVNTASRIQDYAVSGEMLISDLAAQMVKDAVEFETVQNDHFFKGKNKAVDLYRVKGLANENTANVLNEQTVSGYTIHVCGCRGSFPVSGLRFSEYGGETSCYCITKDDYAVIVDCGTGLKNAMPLVANCKKIDILLTHVHYDHILGLLMSKFPAEAKVRIFGQFSAWGKGTSTLNGFMQHPYWPVEITNATKKEIEVGKEISLNGNVKATFYDSDHPDHACVIKLLFEDKKIVFLADCEDASSLDNSISEHSDLLFFDGMFDDEDVISHKGWGHGTWQDGVRFLEGRNIKKLVITHHNPEHGDHSLMVKEMKAREMSPNVSFAKSGDIISI